MKDIFLNCSADSAEISLRIVQAGFVSDMMEDLKHAQHLSADVLEKNKVVLFSMGTVVNCCLHPEVKRLVKEMDLVDIVTPYLHKNNGLVDSIAIALLAHVVKEGQVDLTRIDPKLLRFFTDSVKDAVSRKNKSSGNWQIAELLLTLGLLARCDFNKRLMIADGMTERLLSVLDPSSQRNESEKLHTVNLLLELAKDENNLHVLQTYRRDFLRVMEAIQAGECKEIKELAKNFLDILRPTKDSDTDDDLSQSSDVPDLADLLADQFNLLSIVGMSHVQFVMDKLTTSHPARGDDVTKVKVLKAMAELARKGEKYRREIMARGGLTQVKTVVKDGSEDEQSYTLRVILELIAIEENRLIIKSHPDLIRLLEVVTAKNLDSEEHCETAALLVTTLS